METVVDSRAEVQQNGAGKAQEEAQIDLIEHAVKLMNLLSRSERIMQSPSASIERNHITECVLTLGAVGIAIAYQLSLLVDPVNKEDR